MAVTAVFECYNLAESGRTEFCQKYKNINNKKSRQIKLFNFN